MRSVVVIGGFPRSGTRQFADILNATSECIIQGEIYDESLKALSHLVAATDKAHAGKWTHSSYEARRLEMVLEIYRFASKTKSAPRQWDFTKRNLGFKKPYAEHFHAELKQIFFPSVDKLLFFFCVRNVEDNYLSLASAFGYSPDRYSRGVERSANAVRQMLQDPFFELHALSLDAFINARSKGAWLNRAIFTALGDKSSDEECEAAYASTKNRNRTDPVKRRSVMTDQERRFFAQSDSFLKAVRSLQHDLQVRVMD